jgi:uncharacterized membrane protein
MRRLVVVVLSVDLKPSAALDRPTARRAMWLAWFVVRFGGVVLLTGRYFYPQVDQDIFHYALWAHQVYAGHLPWRDFHVEYPPGALAFMVLPGGNSIFELEFLVLALAADAAIFGMLWRERALGLGSWLWLIIPIAIGPVMWVRYDIFVAAALVGFVVALRHERWRLAGLCLAVATSLKLWPIALLLVLWRVIPAHGRHKVAAWSVGAVTAMVVPIVAIGGGDGLLWMLRFQGSRGLELETVFAWPVVVAQALQGRLAFVPAHGGLEAPISGIIAAVFTVALPLVVAGVTRYAWQDVGRRLTPGLVTLLLVAVVLVCSKMLSPQYVVWAVAVTAVVLDEHSARSKLDEARLAFATVALAVTTQIVFPFYFARVYYGVDSGVAAATAHAEAVLLWVGAVIYLVHRVRRSNVVMAADATADSHLPALLAAIRPGV